MEKEKKIAKKDFDKAIGTINTYYRQITGKNECIQFFVDFVQPIIIEIEKIIGEEKDEI